MTEFTWPDGYERSEQEQAHFLAQWREKMPGLKAAIDREVFARFAGGDIGAELERSDALEAAVKAYREWQSR